MAETLKALTPGEMGNYMPADELVDKRERSEVYETVGEQLMWCYEFDGEVPEHVNFLVELNSGLQVVYSIGGSITLGSVELTTDV